MRFVRFGPAGHERPGILTSEGVVDLGDDFPDFSGEFFADRRWTEITPERLTRLPLVMTDALRLGPPVGRPEKVIGVGLNYLDHARESGVPAPAEPPLFLKAPSSLTGPTDDIAVPPGAKKVDWEVELAVVIGQEARYLPGAEASHGVIAGYVVANDVSERAFQLEGTGQWTKGKSSDTFLPLGPYLASPDEVPFPQRLHLGTRVNGQDRQSACTDSMLFPVDFLIYYISQFMTLTPGDLVLTGTPAGVGFGRKPPEFLRIGDILETWIQGLGSQRNHVVAARTTQPIPVGENAAGPSESRNTRTIAPHEGCP